MMGSVGCVARARPTQEPESQLQSGGLGWVQAGVIVFSFGCALRDNVGALCHRNGWLPRAEL